MNSKRRNAGLAVLTGLAGLLVATPALAASDTDLNTAAATSARVPAAAAAAPVTDHRFAVITAGGSLARGRNAVSATRFGTLGAYEVVFDRDITGCAYLATAGSAGIGTPGAGHIAVAHRSGNPNAVFIATYTPDGATGTPQGFHLQVVC